MKRIKPDFSDILKARFVARVGRLSKFRRLWGTTVVDGIEVFTYKHEFYPTISEDVKKLGIFLDMLDSMQQKQEGVRSVWLYLNSGNAEDTDVDWTKQTLVNNLNLASSRYTKGKITIAPKQVGNRFVDLGFDTVLPEKGDMTVDEWRPFREAASESLVAEIVSKYHALVREEVLITSDTDDSMLAMLLTSIMAGTTDRYEVTFVEESTATLYRPAYPGSSVTVVSDSSKAYTLHIKLKPFVLSQSSDIVNFLYSRINNVKTAYDRYIKDNYLRILLGLESRDGITYSYHKGTTDISQYWHKSGGRHYLKTSILTDNALSKEEKIKYIFSCIDSDYKEKKTKWYDYALIVVVVVAAFVFTGPAGGAAALSVGGGVVGAVVLASVVVTMSALVLTVVAYAASKLDLQSFAQATGKFLEKADPYIKIATVINITAIFYGAIRTGLQVAAEEAAKEGVKASIGDISVAVSKELASTTLNHFTGIDTTNKMQTEHFIKLFNFSFDLYAQREQRHAEKDLENSRKELAKIEEVLEQTKVSDVLKDLLRSQPQLLQTDNSVYAARYDRPYEWWSTQYHTGCSQANSVNALWLDDLNTKT